VKVFSTFLFLTLLGICFPVSISAQTSEEDAKIFQDGETTLCTRRNVNVNRRGRAVLRNAFRTVPASEGCPRRFIPIAQVSGQAHPGKGNPGQPGTPGADGDQGPEGPQGPPGQDAQCAGSVDYRTCYTIDTDAVISEQMHLWGYISNPTAFTEVHCNNPENEVMTHRSFNTPQFASYHWEYWLEYPPQVLAGMSPITEEQVVHNEHGVPVGLKIRSLTLEQQLSTFTSPPYGAPWNPGNLHFLKAQITCCKLHQ